jgi:mannose-6-phosphate isomerase
MNPLRLIKIAPLNNTPLARTPWAGEAIAKIKKTYLQGDIPERIGESWEVSTCEDFPSQASLNDQLIPLANILAIDPESILGHCFSKTMKSHSPILLKWIEAASPLSVQVHPNHSHPDLKADECGKPEAWFVVSADKNSHIFLGFKEELTQNEIEKALLENRAEDVLHRFTPRPMDFIAIPPGCVHALGARVLVIEPQIVLPQKSGKTWRISDWNRRYNAQGKLDPNGSPRDLHLDLSLSAIDWTLPRGRFLEEHLTRHLQHSQVFSGDSVHPFASKTYARPGIYEHHQLHDATFQVVTMWSGQASLSTKDGSILHLSGGESALIAADVESLQLLIEPLHNQEPAMVFFSLNPESHAWHS